MEMLLGNFQLATCELLVKLGFDPSTPSVLERKGPVAPLMLRSAGALAPLHDVSSFAAAILILYVAWPG